MLDPTEVRRRQVCAAIALTIRTVSPPRADAYVPVPVEPPPTLWEFPPPARFRPRRRPGRHRRRPRAGDAAGGLPPRASSRCRRRPRGARWRGSARPPRDPAPARPARLPSLAGPCGGSRSASTPRVAEVIDACADPRAAVGLDRPRRSVRRTSSCTRSAGCTRSRPGATAGSSAGCTAWRSAACSPASRCSTTRPTPRRSRWSGWSRCSTTVATALLDTQWQTPHLASLGVGEVPRDGVLPTPEGVLPMPDVDIERFRRDLRTPGGVSPVDDTADDGVTDR